MGMNPSSEKGSGNGTGNGIKQIAMAFELPIMIVGPVILGGAIGFFLDKWLHTKPLLMIVLGILGIGVGLRDVLKAAAMQDKK
jgi:ATP synthase protein I